MKKTDAHWEDSLLRVPIILGIVGDTGRVFESQAVDGIIEKKGAVGKEWKDLSHIQPLAEEFLSTRFEGFQRGGA